MKRFIVSLATLSISSIALAEPVNVLVRYDRWTQNIYEKMIGDQPDDDQFSLEKDLRLKSSASDVLSIQVKHTLPYLPHIRLSRIHEEHTGFGPDASFQFNNVRMEDGIHSRLNLNHTDAILFGNVVDSRVIVNVGGGLRFYDGEVELRSPTEHRKIAVESKFPVLFVQVATKLPANFQLEGEFTGLGLANNGAGDIQARLSWASSMGLGLHAGYRLNKVLLRRDVGDSGEITAATRGPFMGAFYHF